MARFDSLARFIALFQQLMAHRDGASLEELIEVLPSGQRPASDAEDAEADQDTKHRTNTKDAGPARPVPSGRPRRTGSARRRGGTQAPGRVTRRTLFRDLALLEGMGFSIERLTDPEHPRRLRYRLGRNPMLPFHLEDEEIMALAIVSGFSSAFPDSQLESRLDNAVDRLRKALGRQKRQQLRRMEEVITFLVRNVAGDSIKSRYLWDLLTAIAERRVVQVRYFSRAGGALRTYRLEPYRLILFEGAFYAIVRDVIGQRQLRLHLGRFREMTVLEETFKPDPRFDGEKLLKQGFGISWDREPFTVAVKIAPEAAWLVEERVVHPSQQILRHADGAVTFTMRVSGTPEIKRWLLGFGAAAEVLEPDWLIDDLRAETRKLAARYS
ncbi:MAG: helix-turn-helix transcriptional regulator [Planctomycetota bacterium]